MRDYGKHNTNWTAKITGDMTLALVDENNFQILKVDMLKYKTMEHDTNGDRICTSINNLYIISQFPNQVYDIDLRHPDYDEEGHAPLPWFIEYNKEKRRILLTDGDEKKICERVFPKTMAEDKIEEIYSVLHTGIIELNDILRAEVEPKTESLK